MYSAFDVSSPGFVVAAVAAATIPWTDADKDTVIPVVGRFEAFGTEDGGFVQTACSVDSIVSILLVVKLRGEVGGILATIGRFATAEYMSA